MSSIVDAVKDTISSATESTQQQAPSGKYPQPDQFKAETQVDRVVGIEADIEGPKPIVTEQEGEYGFESYKPAGKLIGKKTIVTGGDSGIGRAVAVMYAMEGADVAIVYLPEEEVDAQETKRLIEQNGQQALLIPQDIREEEGCNRIVDTVIREFGAIDVLVNNASVMCTQESILDITTEQFNRTIDTNLKGTFFLTRAAVPYLKSGASIIITSSQTAYAGPPTLVDYAMSKAGQRGFVYSLSNQLIGKGIRVNAVCPGPVWTPMQPAGMDAKTLGQWHASPAPIGRIGQPAELGPAYVFLASKDGSFISGQSIHVNGGTVVNS